MACILALDIGDTRTTGSLIRLPGDVLCTASRPVTQRAPRPGWAEQDPDQWWSNVCAITRELVEAAQLRPGDLAAIGVTGTVPTLVLLDEAGRSIRPSMQPGDARCGIEVGDLAVEIAETDFLERAGNGFDQQCVAARLRWLRRHEPDNFAHIATVMGSYDDVNRRLTGERAVEQNWALKAGFTDIRSGQIADDLVALAGIPRQAVPRRVLSHEIVGRVPAAAAAATGLPVGVPVVGGAAGHVASAFATGVVRPGDVLLRFGGSLDVLVAAKRALPDARMFLDYHLIPGLFMPNGCTATGGSGLDWFAATFGGGEREAAAAAGQTLHGRLDALAAAVPPGADGVRVAPFFLGEKTPVHEPLWRGAFLGLGLSHGLPHLWRALLESYAFAIRHHVDVFADMGHAGTRLFVSDEGADSTVWMRIVADVLQMPLHRLAGRPDPCLGAAWVAAIGAGLADRWSDIEAVLSVRDTIRPDPALRRVYDKGYFAYRGLASGDVQTAEFGA